MSPVSPYTFAGRLALVVAISGGLSVSALSVATAQEATPGATPMVTQAGATPVATPVAATPLAPPMATPVALPPLEVPLIDANGEAVGLATFSESDAGVTVRLLIEGLTPGEHGWHLHEFGVCDPGGAEPFASAGEHWNPTNMPHGGPDSPEHHVGDIGNLVADANGNAEGEITTADFTLSPGPTSVFDEDGTAIVVHEGMDDLVTQPDGNSGPRYACGVVVEPVLVPATPVVATPVAATPVAATPVATPVATPFPATPVAATPVA
jgi:Cu-Zn family superoxide dismutase